MTRRVSSRTQDEGLTRLMKAVSDSNVKRVRDLIGAEGDVHARDKKGRNVLYHAFAGSEMTEDVLDVFHLLGDHGIDFNSNLDTDGCSALITAIMLDWPIIVQLLIDLGADIHDEGMPKFGASVSTDLVLTGTDADNPASQHRFVFSKGCGQYVSPLLCAVMLQRHAIVDILLSAGADCQQTSLCSFWKSSNIGACSVCDVRISSVHIAAYHGDAELLQQMLTICRTRCVEDNSNISKPIVVSTSPEEDITPLWLALLTGETAAVKTLLEYDFPRAPPCHFGSGLHMCLEEGHNDIAYLLLQSGYDLWEDLEWIESELYPTTNTDIKEFITDFISKPSSLVMCSRNALRQHMGPRLSAYLAAVNVPQKVANVILLKDVLSKDEPASADDVTLMM